MIVILWFGEHDIVSMPTHTYLSSPSRFLFQASSRGGDCDNGSHVHGLEHHLIKTSDLHLDFSARICSLSPLSTSRSSASRCDQREFVFKAAQDVDSVRVYGKTQLCHTHKYIQMSHHRLVTDLVYSYKTRTSTRPGIPLSPHRDWIPGWPNPADGRCGWIIR